jgi:hypothetical protein
MWVDVSMIMNKLEADPLHDLVYNIITPLGGEATLVGAAIVEKEKDMGWE